MELRAYCESYISRRLGMADSSATQLRVAVRRFDAWRGRSVGTQDLSAPLLLAFLRVLLASGQSPATARGKRTSILTLWRAAAREGLAPPVEEVPPIRQPQRLPEAWTVEEVGRLLAECRRQRGRIGPCLASRWWTSFVLLSYDTGERASALRAIVLADLSVSRGQVLVRAAHQKCRRDRALAISTQTVAALSRLHQHKCQCKLLFPWPWTRDTFFRQLRRIVDAAGIPSPRGRMQLSYRLRRASGSLVEAAGGDGAKHLGNTRAVFERSYLDPRINGHGQVGLLPRP